MPNPDGSMTYDEMMAAGAPDDSGSATSDPNTPPAPPKPQSAGLSYDEMMADGYNGAGVVPGAGAGGTAPLPIDGPLPAVPLAAAAPVLAPAAPPLAAGYSAPNVPKPGVEPWLERSWVGRHIAMPVIEGVPQIPGEAVKAFNTPGSSTQISNAASKMAGFGAGDYIQSGLSAPGQYLAAQLNEPNYKFNNMSMGDIFNKDLADQRASAATAQANYPNLTPAVGIASGIPLGGALAKGAPLVFGTTTRGMVAAGTAARATALAEGATADVAENAAAQAAEAAAPGFIGGTAQAAKAGAAQGFAAGFGTGEGGVEKRLESGANMAQFGLILGPVVHTAIQPVVQAAALFKGKPVADVTTQDVADAAQVDPNIVTSLQQAGVTPEQMNAMSPDFAKMAADRVAKTQQPRPSPSGLVSGLSVDADKQPIALGQRAQEAELARVQGQQAGVADGTINPAAVTIPQPKPDLEPIKVGPDGQGIVPDPGTDAGIIAAQQYPQRFYNELTNRINEDPAALVSKYLNVPDETFRGLSPVAQERLVEVAQRQRGIQAPDPTLTTSDAAFGDDPYSPATKPRQTSQIEMPQVKGAAPQGLTDNEFAASKRPLMQNRSGSSDRPFDSVNSSDGLNFADRNPETGQPNDPQAAFFQQRAYDKTVTARAESENDLLNQWAAAKKQDDFNKRTNGSAEYSSAQAKKTFSTTAAPQDENGRYPVDQYGHVLSTKGGPVKFATQKQVAKWILNVGHKNSPDQIFQIDNHPGGSGFTARETGRTETSPPGPAKELNSPNQPTNNGDDNVSSKTSRVNSAGDQPGPGLDERTTSNTGSSAADAPAGRGTGGSAADNAGAGPRNAGDRDAANGSPSDNPTGSVPPASSEVTPENAHRLGTKLYGGVPLDEIGKTISSVGRRTYEDVKAIAQNYGKVIQAWKDANASGFKRGDPITHLARFFFGNTDADMRSLGRQLNSPTFDKVVNMFSYRPGSGEYLGGETYHEGVQHFTKELGAIAAKGMNPIWGDANAMKQAFRQVSSGKITPGTPVGDAAKAISNMYEAAHKYMTDSGMDVGYNKNFVPRGYKLKAAIADGDGFVQALKYNYQKYQGMSPDVAQQAAQTLHDQVVLGASGDLLTPKTPGGKGDFTKTRTFGPEVDDPKNPLNKFLETDPRRIVTGYLRQVVQHGEIAKRFGENFSNSPEMLDQIRKEGGAPGVNELASYIKQATGMNGIKGGSSIPHLESALQSWMLLAKLGVKTTAGIMSETLNAGVRTGNPLKGVEAFGNNLQIAAHWLSGFPETERIAKMKAQAKLLSAIDSNTHTAASAANLEGVGPDHGIATPIRDAFMQMTGIVAQERARVTSNVNINKALIAARAEQYLNGSKFAEGELNDMGIPPAKHQAFAKFVTAHDDPVDNLDQAPAGVRQLYGQAFRRVGGEISMSPTQTTRPKMFTNSPVGRALGGLSGYGYQHFANVTVRAARLAARAATDDNLSTGDRARMLAPLVVGLPTTTLLGAYLYNVRKDAFGNPNPNESTGEKVLHGAMYQTPMAPVERVINAVDSWAHGGPESAARAFEGPEVSMLSDTSTLAASGLSAADGSLSKNAGRKASNILYSDFVAPSLNALTMGGGTAENLSRAAQNVIGGSTGVVQSGKARDAFTDEIAGAKKNKAYASPYKDAYKGQYENPY